MRAVPGELITSNSPTGLPRIASKLHPADMSVSEGSILGWDFWMHLLLQGCFRWCLIPAQSEKSVSLFTFYCFQRIFAARNLRAVKKHLVKQKEWNQGETFPSLLGTTAGHR